MKKILKFLVKMELLNEHIMYPLLHHYNSPHYIKNLKLVSKRSYNFVKMCSSEYKLWENFNIDGT